MIIYTIYKCVNTINGKVYIGFDSDWPSRKQQHYYVHRSKICPDFPFYNALHKYGWENFEWIVLYQSKDGIHCLNEMENYFICENNSFVHFLNSNGYNSNLGGEGTFGKKQSEINKKKQSERRSEYNKSSRWYNNGKQNSLSINHPGFGWSLGRLNQKPTTKGNKWYNDGKNQLLTKNPPVGWLLGMLPR